MRFLVDAQLPRRLALYLRSEGHDAIHTLDLPLQNRTPDDEICALADEEDRVVITKDSDFVSSHTLRSQPRRLLLLSVGNCSNDELQRILHPRLPQVERMLTDSPFVEVTRTLMIARG